MSDDVIDQMIDVLTSVKRDLEELKGVVAEKAPGAEAVIKMEAALVELRQDVKRVSPGAVGQAAENGAKAILPDLQSAAWTLRAALPRVEEAERRRWWLWGAIFVSVVLGHVAAFAGGMVYVRSGLALNTEIGCRYLGGDWSIQKDGAVCVRWR